MRMFRRTAIAGLAVAALALSACAGEASKDEADDKKKKEEVGEYAMTMAESFPESGLIADIKERGVLKVGSKYDQPLIGLEDPSTGEIEGFDAEIARLLATYIFGEVTDENLVFSEATSENRETTVNDGSVDMVIASYSIYPERIKNFDFAGPYLNTGQNVMVAADSDAKTIDDLAGKTVCIAEGSGSIDNMKEAYPEVKVETLKSYGDCAEDLENGNVDGVSTDATILYGFVSDRPESFKVLGEENIFTEENYGIGMKLGETEARSFVNDMLTLALENGDWEKAFNLTFGAADMPLPDPLPTVDNYPPAS